MGFEYKGIAIGSRAQSARTYLTRIFEEHGNSFDDLGRHDLLLHGVKALKGCVHGDMELSKHNVVLGICGVHSEGKLEEFHLIENDDVAPLLEEAFPPENAVEE